MFHINKETGHSLSALFVVRKSDRFVNQSASYPRFGASQRSTSVTLIPLRRAFSLDGLKELDALYEQLLSNLKLAMSVFFSGDVTSARRLRRSKHRFRILNRRYSHAHVDRLHQQNVQSIETSSLHLGLLGDMQRLNSLFCSVAYSVLEQPDEDEGRDEY